MESQNRVQWIYSSIDNNQLAERYDQWASDYESDLQIGYEWHGPQKTVDTLTAYINKQAKILDAGAGTGLVGDLLYRLGFTNIASFTVKVSGGFPVNIILPGCMLLVSVKFSTKSIKILYISFFIFPYP